MICPHCNRRTLYAPADREAIGSCLSCGDIYQASVTRDEIQPELRGRQSQTPRRFTCHDCGWAFTSYAQRSDHWRMWCNRSVASRSGQQTAEQGEVVGRAIYGEQGMLWGESGG